MYTINEIDQAVINITGLYSVRIGGTGGGHELEVERTKRLRLLK